MTIPSKGEALRQNLLCLCFWYFSVPQTNFCSRTWLYQVKVKRPLHQAKLTLPLFLHPAWRYGTVPSAYFCSMVWLQEKYPSCWQATSGAINKIKITIPSKPHHHPMKNGQQPLCYYHLAESCAQVCIIYIIYHGNCIMVPTEIDLTNDWINTRDCDFVYYILIPLRYIYIWI